MQGPEKKQKQQPHGEWEWINESQKKPTAKTKAENDGNGFSLFLDYSKIYERTQFEFQS